MKFKSLSYALAGLVVTAALVLIPAQKVKAAPSEPHGKAYFPGTALIGTWRVQVQQYNCLNEDPIGPSFSSLLTFSAGGTMMGSTTNPAFAAAQRGVDQGVWSFEGRRSYKAKSIVFIYFTTPPAPPMSPGFTAGTQILSQDIEFKNGPDEFSSDAKIQFADATGAVYRQGCASAVGHRFE